MNPVLPMVLTRLRCLILHLGRDRRGSIGLMGVFSILALIGVASLTVEIGQGYSRQAINQHITDEAAYAAAFYYTDGGTSNVAAMTQAAQDLASANGVPNSAVSFAMLAQSPADATKSAVQVSITTQVPISLAGLFNLGSSFPVTTTSIVEVNPAGSCILALNQSGSGITVAVLSAISASQCNVSSASSINVNLLASVCAASIDYGTSLNYFLATVYTTPNCAQGGSNTNAIAKVAPALVTNADPLSDPSNRVQTSFTKLASMPTATVPTLPTPLGTSTTSGCPTINSAGSYSGTCYKSVSVPIGTVTLTASQLQLGTVAVNALGTLSIPNATTIQTSGSVSVALTGTLTINGSPTTIDINGTFQNSGTTTIATPQNFYVRSSLTTSGYLAVGSTPGTVYFASLTSSGTTTNFGGSGSFYIGTITNNLGTLTFGDSAGFYLTGYLPPLSCAASLTSLRISLCNTAGTLTFGNGSLISNGDFAILAGIMNLGNPNGGTTGEYDINGNFYLTAGIVNLGNDGLYLINGYYQQLAGTFFGQNDTVITSGNITVAAGSYFEVNAPTTALSYSIRNVTLASNTGQGSYNGSVSFAGLSGAIGVQGAFYFPYASLNVVAGATLAGNGCLQLIAAQITDAALAFNATSCPGLNGLNAAAGSLVQ